MKKRKAFGAQLTWALQRDPLGSFCTFSWPLHDGEGRRDGRKEEQLLHKVKKMKKNMKMKRMMKKMKSDRESQRGR